MKRASYRHGVMWIAENDEPAEMNTQAIAGLISVMLLADIFGVEPTRVAEDVARYRSRVRTDETRRTQ